MSRHSSEKDMEAGAGRPDPDNGSGERSLLRAVAVAVTVAPAVACLEVLIMLILAGVVLAHPPLVELLNVVVMAPAALIISYFFGIVPSILGALLMYPVFRMRLSAIPEYLAAAVIGAVVVELAMRFFNPAALLEPTGFGVAGILPAMTALHVFRRKICRPSGDRPTATWKRRQPL
jgi:hypothetical protein